MIVVRALAVLLVLVSRAFADPASLHFERTLLNTGGARPELCLRFSARLDPAGAPHYADHVLTTPATHPDLRIEGTDLCLGGLGWGVRSSVTVSPGLAAVTGEVLRDPVRVSVATGDRTPELGLSGAGYVLSRRTAAGVDVQTVNTDRVRVVVWRVSRSSSLRLSGNEDSFPRIDLSATALSSWEFNQLRDSQLVRVWSGTLDTRGARNADVVTSFPVASVIAGERPGLFLVTAEDAATPARRSLLGQDANTSAGEGGAASTIAAHWVDVSDLGLEVLRGADGLHVFARSFATARPVPGATIVLTAAGGDELGREITDAGGGAVFAPGLLRGTGAEAPASLSAGGPDGDWSMVHLTDPWFDLSDRGAEGLPAPGAAQAVLVTDRGIYRPGETVDLTVLLRDHLGAAISDQPLTLVLRRPDGIEARRAVLPARTGGGFVLAEKLTGSAPLGDWTVQAYADPTSRPIGSARFEVQDFVPQTLAVTVTAASPVLTPGQKLEVRLDGRYLYGAPAAGLHGDGSVRIVGDPEPVSGFAGYSFGLEDHVPLGEEQKLDVPDADAAGHATIAVLPKLPAGVTRPLKAIVTAALQDPSGRSVGGTVELKIARTRPLIGLQVAEGRGGGGDAEEAVPVSIVAIAPDGKGEKRSGLTWSVVRENEIFDWIGSDGTWSFRAHVIDEPVLNGTLATGADGRGRIEPSLDPGRYRVIVTDPASGSASSHEFHVGWWATSDNAVTAPDRLAVTVRDSEVAPGGRTVAHIEAPFPGHAQVVIATDRVESVRDVDIPRGGIDIPVVASAAWPGGAYVLATLYRPLDAPARPHEPVRAVGLAHVAIDQSAHHLGVTLRAPETVPSQGRLTVVVAVAGGHGPTHMTLAAVDQGILALTDWRQPDVFALLYGRRAFGLDVADSWSHLMTPAGSAGRIREGGDEAGGGPTGLAVTSTRTVALFSGEVVLDANGHGTATLAVPDFEGTLTLMATAWSADAVGTAQARTVVRDPVFMDLTLPRFLAPGDRATSIVSLVDTVGAAGTYAATVTATGAVSIAGATSFKADLAPGTRRATPTTVVATRSGIGHFVATLADAAHHKLLTRSWDLTVRPAHIPMVVSSVQQQLPGQSITADPALLAPYDPGDATLTFSYSGVHGLDTVGLLQSLEAFSWGSSESLAAAARPLLQFRGHEVLARLSIPGGPDRRIRDAIETLVDREDAAGRIGEWRLNDGSTLPWTQIYLTDFLYRAREAGYDVPPASLGRALDWLDTEQAQGTNSSDGAVTPQTRAYALYVLARAGRLDVPALRALYDDLVSGNESGSADTWGSDSWVRTEAPALSLGHLAAGLALADQRPASNDVFGRAVDALGEPRAGRPGLFDWGYWDYVRDLAGLTPLAAETGNLHLTQNLVDRFGVLDLPPAWLQDEVAASLLEAASAADRGVPADAITVNGKPLPAARHLPVAFSPKEAEVKGFTLLNSGAAPLWLTTTVAGTPRAAPPAISQGMTLSVDALTLAGGALDTAHLRQNDRFLVRIEGASTDDDLHHCVLVDMLPAGWEIEGVAKAGPDDGFAFLGKLTRPQAIMKEDDRFLAAFDLDASRIYESMDDGDGNDREKEGPPLPRHGFRLAYIVRAVTPGQFTRPETVIRDRFRPTLTARTEAGTTIIAPR